VVHWSWLLISIKVLFPPVWGYATVSSGFGRSVPYFDQSATLRVQSQASALYHFSKHRALLQARYPVAIHRQVAGFAIDKRNQAVPAA
jgi:hypothetical protein